MKRKPSTKRRKKSKLNHKKLNKSVIKNSSGFFRRCLSKDFILAIVTVLSLVFGFVQWRQSAKSGKENKALIENNTALLENLVTNKYEKDLQKKYPSGYVLFGVDRSRRFENRSIPHRSNLLEEYEFDWNRVRVSDINENTVTIEMPHIHFKPLGTKLCNVNSEDPKEKSTYVSSKTKWHKK